MALSSVAERDREKSNHELIGLLPAAAVMGWAGEFNVGGLARNAYGEGAVLIGFGTDRGTVAAATDWGGEIEIKSVRPSREDSYEYLFRPRLERAIGVVYRPETELFSHYFEAVLPEQFDAFVWFVDTRAVEPLTTQPIKGAHDTYPFGF